MRYRGPVAIIVALLVAVGVCVVWISAGAFSYRIDPSVSYPKDELPGLDGGPPRKIGTLIGPNGERDEFAVDEVVVRAQDRSAVDAVMNEYGGRILRSGVGQPIEGLSPPNYQPSDSGLLLVRVDLSRSDPRDISETMNAAGIRGAFVFSSEDAVRLVALLARERTLPILPNPVVRGGDSKEHATESGSNLDAETWPWMTEDDDPSTPNVDDGLSVGVARAWDYLYYKEVLGEPGERVPTFAAIIDVGFALDGAGVPLDGNKDYFYYGSKPIQADMVDGDGTAGGRNTAKCGGSSCPWHGQGSFGVIGAVPRNAYGSAGTGGPVVVPILIRSDGTWYGVSNDMYNLADAIRASVLFGAGAKRASVVSISMSGSCNVVCGLTEVTDWEDYNDYMQRTVLTAASFGAIVVAAAGNDGDDLDDNISDLIPCELDAVICVGAVRRNGNAKDYSNYGANVDIWAPTDILTTSDPDTAAADSDDVCDRQADNTQPNDACDELSSFGGTSAATPFVAGVIALMSALDSNIASSGELPPAGTPRVDAIRSILRTTANPPPSGDAKVSPGYIDAARAVMRVRANQRPTLDVVRPTDETVVGWKGRVSFQVEYSDPEVDLDEIYRWAGEVTYASDRDGLLCSSRLPPYSCVSTPGELTVGRHRITVTAVDPFDGTASEQLSIEVVNRPPSVRITDPDASQPLYSDVPTILNAFVSDPDEPIADQQVSWSSSLDGAVGVGRQVSALLSPGSHVLTASAVDGKGVSASDTITVDVASGAGVPSPTIVYPGPDDPHSFSPGKVIVLRGEAVDEEDGELSGSALEWHSDSDGLLGTGTSLAVTLSGPAEPCFPEYRRHQITLLARDSDGNEVSVSTQIGIGAVC